MTNTSAIEAAIDRISSMGGVLHVAIRVEGGYTLASPTDTNTGAIISACLSTLELVDPAVTNATRTIVGERSVNCLRLGDTAIAVVTPNGHPVNKSLQRAMRRTLKQLAKAVPAA